MNVPRPSPRPAGGDAPIGFLADENFDNRIVRALRLRCPDLDIARVQDTVVVSGDDEAVLDWAASQDRVVLTHDVATMIAHARTRVRARKSMPGLVAVPLHCSIASVIADIALIAGAATMADLDGAVVFVPLR